MTLVVTTPPVTEPVTLDLAKKHIRIDDNVHDDVLPLYLAAARQECERYCERAFVTTGFRYTLDAFPAGKIVLPRPNIQGAVDVDYRDSNGEMQGFEDFSVSSAGVLKPASFWPTSNGDFDSVIITFSAGFGAAADVPKPLQLGILILATDFFEMRHSLDGEILLPSVVKRLIDPFRVSR